jgi:hypothetical protein
MEKAIKESLELVKSIEILGVATKKMLADGKINFSDAPIALELIKEIEPVIEGFKGIEGIGEEVKDLSQEELIQLGLAVFNAYKIVAKA